MSRQSSSTANAELDLQNEAELAARGDEAALDRLFALLGGSAWGVAFAAADAVGPAADAVATGFAETLQLFDNGLPVNDLRVELLQATRSAALTDASVRNQIPGVEGVHAREPLSLLGETKDRQATLALTALPEEMRSALWLVEAERLSITKAARLLGESHKNTEDLVRHARAGFRGYYVDAVKRDGLSATCTTTLDKLAGYVGRSLPAGEVAAVEHHLAECKECRAIVMKLDDLEGRLHAAIPPLPAWTRQQVADTWAEYVPVKTATSREPLDDETKRRPVGALIGLLAVAAAAAVVLLGTGVFDSSNSQPRQIAAANAHPGAVSTPRLDPIATTSTTVPPATTTTTVTATTLAPVTPTTTAPVTTPTTVAVIRRPPTTRAPVAPKPPVTSPPGNSLINLPPTPISR